MIIEQQQKTHNWKKNEINNDKKKIQQIISNYTNRKKGTKAVQQEESNKTVRHILFSN